MVTKSECGSNRDPDILFNNAASWSWFMNWYGDYTRMRSWNSLDLWEKYWAIHTW